MQKIILLTLLIATTPIQSMRRATVFNAVYRYCKESLGTKIILLTPPVTARALIHINKKDEKSVETNNKDTDDFKPAPGTFLHQFEGIEIDSGHATNIFYSSLKNLPEDLQDTALRHYEQQDSLNKGRMSARQLLGLADLYQDIAKKRQNKVAVDPADAETIFFRSIENLPQDLKKSALNDHKELTEIYGEKIPAKEMVILAEFYGHYAKKIQKKSNHKN